MGVSVHSGNSSPHFSELLDGQPASVNNTKYVSQDDPWQEKFTALFQEIHDIKTNRYLQSDKLSTGRLQEGTSHKLDHHKHQPMDKHVQDVLDGIYCDYNKYEAQCHDQILGKLSLPIFAKKFVTSLINQRSEKDIY